MRHGERLETLFGVLATAFCRACQVSAWRQTRQVLRLKTHGRPAPSVFRCGFDGIRRAVLKASGAGGELERLLRLMCQAVTSPKTLRLPLYPMQFCRVQWRRHYATQINDNSPMD